MNPRDADHRAPKLAPGGARMTIVSGLRYKHVATRLLLVRKRAPFKLLVRKRAPLEAPVGSGANL